MASTSGWNSSTEPGAVGNDQSLNNSSGFNVFPEGIRISNASDPGSFNAEGSSAIFWSSTELTPQYPWYRDLYINFSYLERGYASKRVGFSVRFVRE